MNFLEHPKNIDYVLQFLDSDGGIVKTLKGSDALTALSSIEKTVTVDFITSVNSGDLTVISDNIYPNIAFNSVRLLAVRERDLNLGYEPEAMEQTIFQGEVTLPYRKDASNKVTFPIRSFIPSKNVIDDMSLGWAKAKEHVLTFLAFFDGIVIDQPSFDAINDPTNINLFIEKDWFTTYNEIITGLCWLGRFAIYFEGNVVKAVPLLGSPTEYTTIKNSDILLEEFLVDTKAETEVITRIMVNDPNGNKVSWYNNVDVFGDNVENVTIPYYGTLTHDTNNAVNFWLANKSKLWLRFNLKLPLKYLNLQPYEIVKLENVADWVGNINLQPIERLYFDRAMPTLYQFPNNDLRPLFKNGGYMWFKAVVETPLQLTALVTLGHGTGLWVDTDGHLVYRTVPDQSDNTKDGIWTSTETIDFDTLIKVEVYYDEESLIALPEIKVDDIALTMVGDQPTLASLYESDGVFVGYPHFQGFLFDLLFYNQTEQITVFKQLKDGPILGAVTPTVVPALQESALRDAFGRVIKVNVNFDGTLTALIESDIDGFSGNRDESYWTGPGNDSGIEIIGQTIDELGMATLEWRPLTTNFTKYEVDVEKNGDPFANDDDVTAITKDVQLTVEENNTYIWKVRGYTSEGWQPWSYASQFRYEPDEWTDGRIVDMEWFNNEYVNPYGPEYNNLLPERISFVVNFQFSILQARARNQVQFSGTPLLPARFESNIQANVEDRRFYVRGLDSSTDMWSMWYWGPEYNEHPGVPDDPSGYTGTEMFTSGAINSDGPFIWQTTSGAGRLYVNIPDRASSITAYFRFYNNAVSKYVPLNSATIDITSYPYKGVFTENDVVSFAFFGMAGMPNQRNIQVVLVAHNAAGSSDEVVICSNLVREENGTYSVNASCLTDAVIGSVPERVTPVPPDVSPEPDTETIPTPLPEVPEEEEAMEFLPLTLNYYIGDILPATASHVVVAYQTAKASINVFDYPNEPVPDVLADGSMDTPVSKYVILPRSDTITIPSDNLAQVLAGLGFGRASFYGQGSYSNPPVNSLTDRSAPAAYWFWQHKPNNSPSRGGWVARAGQTAFQVWFFDALGNAVGERSDNQQNVNKEVHLIEAHPDNYVYDRLALEENAIVFDNSYEVIEFPCRPDTLDALTALGYPPCNFDLPVYPPVSLWNFGVS